MPFVTEQNVDLMAEAGLSDLWFSYANFNADDVLDEDGPEVRELADNFLRAVRGLCPLLPERYNVEWCIREYWRRL